jgi:hypothetical protein
MGMESLLTLRALSMVALVSKDRCASTSVETRPGTTLSISTPMFTARMSATPETQGWMDGVDLGNGWMESIKVLDRTR